MPRPDGLRREDPRRDGGDGGQRARQRQPVHRHCRRLRPDGARRLHALQPDPGVPRQQTPPAPGLRLRGDGHLGLQHQPPLGRGRQRLRRQRVAHARRHRHRRPPPEGDRAGVPGLLQRAAEQRRVVCRHRRPPHGRGALHLPHTRRRRAAAQPRLGLRPRTHRHLPPGGRQRGAGLLRRRQHLRTRQLPPALPPLRVGALRC